MKKKILAALTAGILTTGLMTGGVFAADTEVKGDENLKGCLLYTSPSPRDCS